MSALLLMGLAWLTLKPPAMPVLRRPHERHRAETPRPRPSAAPVRDAHRALRRAHPQGQP